MGKLYILKNLIALNSPQVLKYICIKWTEKVERTWKSIYKSGKGDSLYNSLIKVPQKDS